MRSNDEYRQILKLWDAGKNKSVIARTLSIPRATIRDCIKKFGSVDGLETYLEEQKQHHWTARIEDHDFRLHYAYMLGIYLGDGYIATHPRTYRLRVVLDLKYPKIIQRVIHSMGKIAPNNIVGTVPTVGSVEVSCYANHWVEMFPQHGEGFKHERVIKLDNWQQAITDEHVIELVRGLYHSDGSRTVPYKGTDKELGARYYFSNVSEDIHTIFTDAIETLGLGWTRWGRTVTISRRADVAFLEEHIGAKC